MKKTFVTIASLALCAAMFLGFIAYQQSSNLDPLLKENIEALAGEPVEAIIKCDGDGAIFCPLTQTSVYRTITITQI